jgi:hypothetical protein
LKSDQLSASASPRRIPVKAIRKVKSNRVKQYSFLKFPSAEELQKDAQTFAVGKFRDVQINELNVYSDGIIVSGRCDTKVLEAFLGDLFGWMKADYGYEQTTIIEPEMHFESNLVVRANKDLTAALSPPKRVTSLIEQTLTRFTDAQYLPTSTSFETDSVGLKTRRRPYRFSFERRLGMPFAKNVFYSQAPLRTDDHLSLLAGLEELAD